MRPQSKKIVALFLIFSLMAINCSTLKTFERRRKTAKRKHGVLLLSTKKDGGQITGELVAVKVKQKSLLLLESESKADVSVDIKDVKAIRIVKKSKASSVASAGFLAGAVLGAFVGNMTATEIQLIEGPKKERDGSKVWLGALIGDVLAH